MPMPFKAHGRSRCFGVCLTRKGVSPFHLTVLGKLFCALVVLFECRKDISAPSAIMKYGKYVVVARTSLMNNYHNRSPV